MTSRTDFAAELADLQRKLADQPAPRIATPRSAPEDFTLDTFLGEHLAGLKSIEDLWDRLNDELDGVPKDKPLLTLIAALGVGYLLGRATR